MEPLRTLLEDPPAGNRLPAEFGELYGGLDLAPDLLYANFISSLDGVVTLGPSGSPGPVLRGDDEADGLVMGLLRIHADALVIGAGTLRAELGHQWTAAYVDPRHRDAYRAFGRPDPRLVVVTASGELGSSESRLPAGALLLTTDAGAARLSGRLPAGCRVRTLGDAPKAADIVAAVRAEGHRRILCEGGPTLLGRMVDEGVLDELFLTLSPVLAGRQTGDGRLGFVQGFHFLPGAGRWARLRSLRGHGSHLFLRYALDRLHERREQS